MNWKFEVEGLPPEKVWKLFHVPLLSLYWKYRFSLASGVSPQPERPSWTQAWKGTLTPPAKLTTGEVP